MIDSVLNGIVTEARRTDEFKKYFMSLILGCNDKQSSESSMDYVFLSAKRTDHCDTIQRACTAAGKLELGDTKRIIGVGEAKRLLAINAVEDSMEVLAKKIETEISANFSEFAGPTNGDDTSGLMVYAFSQAIGYVSSLSKEQRDSHDFLFFMSDGLLWRFGLIQPYSLLLSKCMLLGHEGLPTNVKVNNRNNDIVRHLAYMLFRFSLKAQVAALVSYLQDFPGITVPSQKHFVLENDEGRHLELDVLYYLGRGRDRAAFVVRPFKTWQPLRVAKLDLSPAVDGAMSQTDREMLALKALRGRPGVPELLDYGALRRGGKYIITNIIGMPLEDYIAKNPARANFIFEKGVTILESLWAAGYVVSDINGSFMVVDQDENVWFSDLGACYSASDPAPLRERLINHNTATFNTWIGFVPSREDELAAFKALFKGCAQREPS
eukprot:TRINITY_DN2800_c0_g1_i1.p1 TRINITY_DN2800_c0_g1~~TRINITY_DN2800_c0_g1_i1.p1  ORF type:complete len:437 (+),score=69.95 TRINITY_DN2800_c0_g1_i1:1809-3119(+)